MITKKINGNEEIVAVDKFQLDHTANAIRADVQALSSKVDTKAAHTDLTSIIATGSTNTTGAQILRFSYFYLNNILCRAKMDINSGSAFTKNTNYEEVELSDRLSYASTFTYKESGGSPADLEFSAGEYSNNAYFLIGWFRSTGATPSNYDGFAIIKRNGSDVSITCKQQLESVTAVSLSGNNLVITVGSYMSLILVRFM